MPRPDVFLSIAARPTVARDLALLVASESFGQSLFSLSARLTADPSHRCAWRQLEQLELQTKRGLSTLLHNAGLEHIGHPRVADLVGRASAVGLRCLPWRQQLSVLLSGTARFLPAFLRLQKAYAETRHAAFFAYVVQHELAIADFARAALSGLPDPLAHVACLLGTSLSDHRTMMEGRA